jgi:hypothetical protein
MAKQLFRYEDVLGILTEPNLLRHGTPPDFPSLDDYLPKNRTVLADGGEDRQSPDGCFVALCRITVLGFE